MGSKTISIYEFKQIVPVFKHLNVYYLCMSNGERYLFGVPSSKSFFSTNTRAIATEMELTLRSKE